jgi:hypothetical protein
MGQRVKSNEALEKYIRKQLSLFEKRRSLPGIQHKAERDSFIRYIIESKQRVEQVQVIRSKVQKPECADSTRNDFNPLKAAAYHKQKGNLDEAFWLAFLATHFGEDEKKTKWGLVRNVYRGLGNNSNWTWNKVSADPDSFRKWLISNRGRIEGTGQFGNHRKYESLKDGLTGKTVASYIKWVGTKHKHHNLINSIRDEVGANPHDLFDALYKSMSAVFRFGRMARFDYLTTVGKLGLVNIEPGNPYLPGATGPRKGACLLFGGNGMRPKVLNSHLQELAEHLNLFFGMQLLEDAICNWQKSPVQFVPSLEVN